MIGQMQGMLTDFRKMGIRLGRDFKLMVMTGKYQLQVFPEAGHFIQEDLPEKTAMVLADFYRRNDRSALVLPPKVGDLLKKKT